MNRWQQQTQALAGVMQAVCQIDDIASRGETNAAATRASLSSVLRQTADDLNEAVGSVGQLHYGLQRMLEMLQGEQKYLPALQYAMAVMQMEKNLRRSDTIQQAVDRELHLINMSIAEDTKASDDGDLTESSMADEASDPLTSDHADTDHAQELIAQLADVWTTQVRKLEPQVVVHGKPLYLQNENNIQLIRALLLSALRCSWLWSQLGGRRWHLLLRRKRLLQSTRQLLAVDES
jgi:high frequency lysogenization protein